MQSRKMHFRTPLSVLGAARDAALMSGAVVDQHFTAVLALGAGASVDAMVRD